MSKKLAWAWLDAFYDEGDIDWIFFWQLIGAVSEEMEEDEHGCSVSFNKTLLQRKNDALRLAKYLVVDMGDFKVYDAFNKKNYSNGFIDFCDVIENLYTQNDFEHDITFNMTIALEKLEKGKPAPLESEVPPEIVDLFQER